jgi:hypothetical protein
MFDSYSYLLGIYPRVLASLCWDKPPEWHIVVHLSLLVYSSPLDNCQLCWASLETRSRGALRLDSGWGPSGCGLPWGGQGQTNQTKDIHFPALDLTPCTCFTLLGSTPEWYSFILSLHLPAWIFQGFLNVDIDLHLSDWKLPSGSCFTLLGLPLSDIHSFIHIQF